MTDIVPNAVPDEDQKANDLDHWKIVLGRRLDAKILSEAPVK